MKFTKLIAEPKGLTTQMLWLAMAKGITLVLSFMLPFVLVRKLSQTQFGLYKQAFQIMTTAVSILGLQVASSVYYFMPREPKKHAAIAQNVFLFYLSLGAIVASLFAVYPSWTNHIFQNDGLAPAIPMLGLAIMFWLGGSGIESVMIVNRDVRLASVFTLILQSSKVALLILAALVWGSIKALIVAALLQGSLSWVMLFFYLRRRYGQFWFPIDWRLFRAQIGNALPFGLGGIAAVAMNDLHNYFVSYHFEPAVFAIYATGCFQLPLMSVLFDAVETVLTPEFGRLESTRDHAQIIEIWMNAIRQLALVFIPICTLLFVVRYEFIVMLFTKNYVASAPIFAVNLVGVLLSICIYMPVLRNVAEFRFFRVKLYLILLPISCVALYIGIHQAGLLGAITAVVMMRALDIGISMTVIGHKLEITLKQLKPLASIVRTAAAAFLAATVTYLLRLALAHQPILMTLLTCSIVFSALFVVSAFMTGAITNQEKEELRKLWQRFFSPTHIELSSESLR